MSAPEELVVELDSFSAREMIAVEDLADMPFDSLGDPKAKKGRLIAAIATVMKQRTDPSFTFEQALDHRITLTDKDRADPTDPGDAPD